MIKQKYLNIDKGFNKYIVRVVISGKHLIVWRGSDYTIGIKIAKKVESLMNISKAKFLDWYDNDMEAYLYEVQNKDENK